MGESAGWDEERPENPSVAARELPVEPPGKATVARALRGRTVDSANPTSDFVQTAVSGWVAGGYVVGVLVMFVRLFAGLSGGYRMRRLAHPIGDGRIQQLVERQVKALGLKIAPVVAYCEQVAVPAVVGIMRPVILLPVSMASGMPEEQLSSVITHELAHLRRFDHIVIVFQRILEALWFFHPVCWYLSRQLNREREHCCDDVVVAAGVERAVYAESLCRVAELTVACRSRALRPAMLGAEGQCRSHLYGRIVRLLEGSPQPAVRLTRSGMFGVAATLALLGGAALLLPSFNGQTEAGRLADQSQETTPLASESNAGRAQKAPPPDTRKQSADVDDSSRPSADPTKDSAFHRSIRKIAEARSGIRSYDVTITGKINSTLERVELTDGSVYEIENVPTGFTQKMVFSAEQSKLLVARRNTYRSKSTGEEVLSEWLVFGRALGQVQEGETWKTDSGRFIGTWTQFFDPLGLGLCFEAEFLRGDPWQRIIANYLQWSADTFEMRTLADGRVRYADREYSIVIDTKRGQWPVEMTRSRHNGNIEMKTEIDVTNIQGHWLPETATVTRPKETTNLEFRWNSVNAPIPEERFTKEGITSRFGAAALGK